MAASKGNKPIQPGHKSAVYKTYKEYKSCKLPSTTSNAGSNIL